MVTLSEVHYKYEQYLKAWFQVREVEEEEKKRWRNDIYEWSEKTLLELNFLVNDRIGWKDLINNV